MPVKQMMRIPEEPQSLIGNVNSLMKNVYNQTPRKGSTEYHIITSIFRKMFPGTDFKVVSREGGALFTRNGLPLKGLLLPNVESITVLG